MLDKNQTSRMLLKLVCSYYNKMDVMRFSLPTIAALTVNMQLAIGYS